TIINKTISKQFWLDLPRLYNHNIICLSNYFLLFICLLNLLFILVMFDFSYWVEFLVFPVYYDETSLLWFGLGRFWGGAVWELDTDMRKSGLSHAKWLGNNRPRSLVNFILKHLSPFNAYLVCPSSAKLVGLFGAGCLHFYLIPHLF